MNLANGVSISGDCCHGRLETLRARITETLSKPLLDPMLVVDACDVLSRNLHAVEYKQELLKMGMPLPLVNEYIADAKRMLSKKYLERKLSAELGADFRTDIRYRPENYDLDVREWIHPLGVLFHIAAGNMEGLPAFTVIEGLLAGNINILKLPGGDSSLSVRILKELAEIEPRLAEYIYVFDFASKDIQVMKQFADLADAVVIWGGDAAVKAVREMAAPNTKIIEWGHKISFAYVSGKNVSDQALEGIAWNICYTNQLLCSSCQGVYVDTEDMAEVEQFCKRFLPIMERAFSASHAAHSVGIEAQTALRVYNEQLHAIFNETEIFKGENCCIIAYTDMELTSSMMYGNPWVRRLPRSQIVTALRPYKNYLQTIGLVCDPNDASELMSRFWNTGAVRITDGRHMSEAYWGMPHDGEYPLRRYTKRIACECF